METCGFFVFVSSLGANDLEMESSHVEILDQMWWIRQKNVNKCVF